MKFLKRFIAELGGRERFKRELPRTGQEEFVQFANTQDRIIWIASPSGVAYFFNNFGREILGLGAQEIDANAWLPAVHPADRARAEREWADAVKLGSPYACEFRLYHRSVDCYQAHRASARPILDARGKVQRWYGIFDNIEELKLAEKRFIAEEKKLASVLAASPAAIGVFSGRENRCVFANPKLLELLGIGPLRGERPLAALITDPSHRAILTLVEETERTNRGVHRIDLKLNRGGIGENAQPRYFHFFAEPLAHAEGAPPQRVLYLRDISDQRNADERLSRSERKFRRLFSSNLLGIVFWNVHQTITEANQAFLDLLGFSAVELVGLPLAKLSAPDFYAQDCLEQELLSVQERTTPVEKELLKKDGARVPVVAGSGWISKTSGEGFSFVLDRTELKRAGEERARLQGRADSEKEAGRAKSQFLATMSHEIRTPLHAILGFTKFLNDSSLSDEQRGHLRSLTRAGENLLHLTNDILDLSRIEAKAVRLEIGPLNPSTLVSEVVEMVRAAHPHAVPIRVRVHGEPVGALRGDGVRLGQVITNLLSNAVKFTPAGQIDIDLTFRALGHERVGITFTCRDTGVGIEPGVIARLFKPFARAESDGGPRAEGTGLGLWISRQLAELMGGDLTLSSEPGRGTLVTFSLALTRSTEPPPEVSPPLLTAPEPLNLHVLVAEDNQMNQVIAARLLTRAGCTVTIAQNGEAALRSLGLATYDLLLLDCQMPDIDGYEVARAVRALEKREGRAALPIIAVTADAMADSKRRCTEAGMNDYVSKPFDHDVLLAKIRNLSSRSTKIEPRLPSAPRLDQKVLADLWRVDGNGALLAELLKIFSANMPERLSHLAASAGEGDSAGMMHELHALRACFGSVGFRRAAESCRALEEMIGLQPARARSEEAALIQCEFGEGQKELAAWLAAYPPTLSDGLAAAEGERLTCE